MMPLFSVETTAAFMRWFSKLARKHAELPGLLADAKAILAADPYNRTRAHNIKKLTAIPRGEDLRPIRRFIPRLSLVTSGGGPPFQIGKEIISHARSVSAM